MNNTIEFPEPKSIFDVDFNIISEVKNPDNILPVEFRLTGENKEPYFLKIQGYKKNSNIPEYPIICKFSDVIGKRTLDDIEKNFGNIIKIELLDSDDRNHHVSIREL
ncbi:MAG: hypothetical protein ABIJ97_00555 [Bacteroidota bacterium]